MPAPDPTAACARQLARRTIPNHFDTATGRRGDISTFHEITVTVGPHSVTATCEQGGRPHGYEQITWWLRSVEGRLLGEGRFVIAEGKWVSEAEIAERLPEAGPAPGLLDMAPEPVVGPR